MTRKLSKDVTLPVLSLWIALSLAAPSAGAQQDSARLAGTVHSSLNGRPLAGVMIAVAGTQTFDVTDSAGAFALSGLPAGKQTVRILYRDEVFHERGITLKAGKRLRLEILLDVDAVALAPVVVEARSIRATHSLAGFYERKKRGFGRFYTFEDLERRGYLPLRTLLVESGVQVRCGGLSCFPVSGSVWRRCVLPLYLDGLPFPVEDMDFIHADELAGLEVYKHGLDVPVELQVPFGSGCGAVMMWSRY